MLNLSSLFRKRQPVGAMLLFPDGSLKILSEPITVQEMEQLHVGYTVATANDSNETLTLLPTTVLRNGTFSLVPSFVDCCGPMAKTAPACELMAVQEGQGEGESKWEGGKLKAVSEREELRYAKLEEEFVTFLARSRSSRHPALIEDLLGPLTLAATPSAATLAAAEGSSTAQSSRIVVWTSTDSNRNNSGSNSSSNSNNNSGGLKTLNRGEMCASSTSNGSSSSSTNLYLLDIADLLIDPLTTCPTMPEGLAAHSTGRHAAQTAHATHLQQSMASCSEWKHSESTTLPHSAAGEHSSSQNQTPESQATMATSSCCSSPAARTHHVSPPRAFLSPAQQVTARRRSICTDTVGHCGSMGVSLVSLATGAFPFSSSSSPSHCREGGRQRSSLFSSPFATSLQRSARKSGLSTFVRGSVVGVEGGGKDGGRPNGTVGTAGQFGASTGSDIDGGKHGSAMGPGVELHPSPSPVVSSANSLATCQTAMLQQAAKREGRAGDCVRLGPPVRSMQRHFTSTVGELKEIPSDGGQAETVHFSSLPTLPQSNDCDRPPSSTMGSPGVWALLVEKDAAAGDGSANQISRISAQSVNQDCLPWALECNGTSEGSEAMRSHGKVGGCDVQLQGGRINKDASNSIAGAGNKITMAGRECGATVGLQSGGDGEGVVDDRDVCVMRAGGNAGVKHGAQEVTNRVLRVSEVQRNASGVAWVASKVVTSSGAIVVRW